MSNRKRNETLALVATLVFLLVALIVIFRTMSQGVVL